MEYKIETLTAQQIVYMRQTGAYGGPENFMLMERFKGWIAVHGLETEAARNGIYGVAQDDPQTTLPQACRYDLMLVTKRNFSEDPEVCIDRLAGGRYAVFTVPHTREAVQAFWREFAEISKELPLSDLPPIERYKEAVGPDKNCEFLIPVE